MLERLEDRTVPASADLSVLNSAEAFRPAGGRIDYALTLTNNGPDSAANVVLTDTNSAVAGVIVPGSATITLGSGTDVFRLTTTPNGFVETATGPIAAGSVDIFFVHLMIEGSAPNGSAVANTASVASTTPDPDPSNNTAVVNTTVVTPTDVAVTKTGPAMVMVGATINYTISVTNKGPVDAYAVTLVDALPRFVTLLSETQLSGPDSFSNASQNDTADFTANKMGNGNTDVFRVVAQVGSDAPVGTTLDNFANISTANPDPDSSNDSSEVQSAVLGAANLSVIKTGPATVTAGTQATYTITLTDNGTSDAASVQLSDALPGGMTLVSEAQTGGPDSFTHTSSGNTASFTATTMTAGNTDTFTVVALVSSSAGNNGTTSNTATASASNAPTVSSTLTSNVTAVADLVVTKVGPATLTAGSFATYTISLTNLGPSDAAIVQLTDALPSGLARAAERPGPNNPDPFTDASQGHVVTFNGATVGAGNTDTFIIEILVDSSLANGSTVSNTANVFASNSNDASSTFTSTVTSTTTLSVVKTGPATVTAGTSATYTISLTNIGSSDAANVQLTDVLPTGLTLISEMQMVPVAVPFTNNSTGNTVNFTAASFPSGPTEVFEVVAGVASNLANGSTVSDTATAAAGNAPSVSSTVTSTVSNPTATTLSIIKTGSDTITAGAQTTYAITLSNTGTHDATSVQLTDMLPAGLTLVSETQTGPDTFTNNSSDNTVRFLAAAMGAGNTDTFVVVASVASSLAGGSMVSNTAMATANNAPKVSSTFASTVSSAPATIALTVPPISTTEFAPLNNVAVATFTFGTPMQPASAFTATIHWGDGTTTTGTVTQSGTSFMVVGSHTYNVDSAAPITVTVMGASASATGSAAVSIAEAPVPAGALGLPQDSFIFETMDDLFQQPLSLSQLQGLEFTFLFMEFSAFNLFMQQGMSQALAFNTTTSLAQQDFAFLAMLQASSGMSLDTAVTNMEFSFLAQGQILNAS
jgi:uncharacterized repeat protein (TIGR01451 family)